MSDVPLTTVPYGRLDADMVARWAALAPEDDGPVWMVNLMSYRERAAYADGRETDLTGREADDRYAPLEVLADIGAEIVLVAEVEDQLLGPEPRWDRVAVVRYPSRRAFAEMATRADYRERHVHKEAGMEATIITCAVPIGSPADAMDPDAFVDWGEVPHPPTDEDGPVEVLHLIRFHPGRADDEMVRYQDDAALVAVPHGVRIAGWFSIEGTVIGDGRGWDQVRFNTFPSREAFMAVVFDPQRLEAQRAHREVAIADTYTLVLRPVIDRLGASVAEARADGG